ncbi:MAG TPA: hypothetical protein VJM15_05345 [Sphingomicrobium sp.]|nr:hypothetical protein [Sphingomicrobium sp.]
MTDQDKPAINPRQRAVEAYESARDRTVDGVNGAPLLALAGGLAAGALVAALLPRTRIETEALRPTAKRIRRTAKEAVRAAKDTGSERLNELGLTREKGEETIRSLFEGVTDAARASGQAAVDAVKNQR